MASVPSALVKELRERTGASMGKCREALSAEEGDVGKAAEWLRKRGIRSMERRAAEAGEGLLALSLGPSAGALVELRAETDFVTRGEIFQQLNLCLASTLAREAEATANLSEAALQDDARHLKQLRPGTSVAAALLELGSVLGERLVLGQAHVLPAPLGGVVGGYVHPKQADGLLGTGRMAALVALRPLPVDGCCNLERLQAIAAQLARHIVASQPRFLSIASVPAVVLQKERETLREAYLEQLGPKKAGSIDESVLAKVLDGKTQKFYQESVLLCQELVAPQTPAGGEGKAAPRPVPVEEWLQAEATSIGVEKVVVENFRLASV